jgi:acyl-CoA thioesterase-1
MKVVGDSLVLARTDPGALCFEDLVRGSVQVRSTYDASREDTIRYEEGRDYTVDYERGTIARTPNSRIPDFSRNVLYGQKEFDHSQFTGIGNHAYFVWVDYETRRGRPLAEESRQGDRLRRTRERLNAGGAFKIIAFGDSITTGGEASTEALQFFHRYGALLRQRFPKAQITVENGATGGDTTVNGLARLEEKVLSRQPDLVLVGFGMNDHNIEGFGVPLAQFEENLVTMVTTIRERTGADVLLFSAFPPHPDWKFGSHRMEQYAAATQRAAERTRCAYADVYSVWARVLARKDASSLLGNNINHPNDFGHWLYYEALKAVRF